MQERKRVNVIAIPSVAYGKFSWKVKPCDDRGEMLLAALKKQFGYTPPVKAGKQLEGCVSFKQEWIDFAQQNINVDFIVVDAPIITPVMIGDKFSNDTNTSSVRVDYSFI